MAVNLFPDYDIEADVPSLPADGSHLFVLKTYSVSEAPWDGKTYLKLNYVLEDSASELNGYKYSKKFWLPTGSEREEDKAETTKVINKYRSWLRAHGIPEDELSSPDLDSITGLMVEIYGQSFDAQNGKMWAGMSAKVV